MKILIAVVAALAISGSALAQELAGRVLLSVGNVALVRGGATSAPAVGTAVLAGDTFRLGDQSNVQLRMTDQSLVSLQPNTTFTISEYAYAGKEPGSQRTVLTLLAGAMRTVTGLIGRTRPDDYRVRTPTATIGIRGTHYQIAHLEKPQGDLAAGTYGAVTDGRISVSTQGGENAFGADQHFHVARATEMAVGRAGPPPRLSQIAPPARPQPQQQEQQRARGETTPTVATTGDSRVSNAANGVAVAPAVRQDSATATSVSTGGGTTTSGTSTESAPIAAQPASLISISGPATIIGGVPIVQPTLTGTVYYRLAGPINLPVTNCTGTCSNIVNGSITLGVNLTQQLAGVKVDVIASDGGILNIGTPLQSGGIPVTISNGVVTFSQTFRLVDFPLNQGAFRCFDCGSGTTAAPNFFQTITFSGTINGSQATVTVSGTDSGGSGSVTTVLNQVSLPNDFVAAATVPGATGGNSTSTGAFWAVNLDGSRRLVELSSGATTGVTGTNPAAPGPRAFVNTATNTIKGSDALAGNLVWGVWGNGASVTDFNYTTFNTTSSNTPVHWITGTATNTLVPALGVLSYTPVGYFINNGTGTLNAATLKADFVARSVQLNLTASNSASNAFTMAGTTSFSSTNGRFSSGFQSVTCAGPSCPASSGGSYGGFFAGPNGEGAGVAFTAGGAGSGVNGVVGFKR